MWSEIVKILIDFFSKFKEIDNIQKEKITKLLSDISVLIEQVGNDIGKDIYPHGSCAAMQVLSIELVNYLKGKMSEEKLNELHLMLLEASRLEREYAMRKDETTVASLYVIAGKFKGMSIYYNV